MKTTILGFPNAYQLKIKKAVEGFWKNESTEKDIDNAFEEVIEFNKKTQSFLDLRPIFDIDIYDRLLKTAVIFGIVPKRFGDAKTTIKNKRTYLSIGRGNDEAQASPMVKWFNSNYHVIQPEIENDPKLIENPPIPNLEKNEKLALIGPWTFLNYAVNRTKNTKETLFEKLCEQYVALLQNLPKESIIQLEEPSFLTHGFPQNYRKFIERLTPTIHLHIYFGAINDFADELFELPVQGIGLDFIDGPENLSLLEKFPKEKMLIAGIINGRNVWPATTKTKNIIDTIRNFIPDEKLYISPSCSLSHLPVSSQGEAKNYVFAKEKIEELEAIKNGTIKYKEIKIENEKLPDKRYERSRKNFWVSDILYPTSTIGSFPQTNELRAKRKKWQNHEISDKDYETAIKKYIKNCVEKQDELGLDVLVHGEPERNDMVQYFAEHLEGIEPIKGWVQSYGTRYTRPPVITGPVSRPKPFTVQWITYANSLTNKPVKGMLTGPVTIVQWSYPREDISKEAQFYDVAGALAEEVKDLVKAKVTHIQIDEPAIREGLPLNPSNRPHYLFHAINAFRKVYADVPDETVIYSHICFSEFTDIMDAIRDMGVDVLSIEDSKAKGKTAKSIREGGFPGSIGLGVFDVHSPRIPKVEEILEIPKSLNLDRKKIWINPDCGLKTRGNEAYEQLAQMMKAVKILRENATKI